MKLPDKENPLHLPAVFFNKILRGDSFYVDIYKTSHARIRAMVKRYTKAGYLTATQEGRLITCKIDPSKKFEFLKFLSEKNFHVKQFIKPTLLHLPKPTQQ